MLVRGPRSKNDASPNHKSNGRLTKHRRVLAAIAVALLVLSGAPIFAEAGTSGSGTNWSGVDGNFPLNWNYSPQTAIDPSNVKSLQVQWTFPVPAAPPAYVGAEGVMVTPLVVNGIAYVITNWHRVFALNAGNGNVVWYHDLPLSDNYSRYLQASVPGPLGLPLGHYHQMTFTSHILNRPLIWVISNTYQVFALDAYTGDLLISFNPLIQSKMISGNFGIYDVDTPSISIDDSRGLLLFGPSVSEGESSGRGMVEGWNVNVSPPTLLWQEFIIPPQNGQDPGWSLKSVQNMSHAYIFNGSSPLDLKSLSPDVLRSMLYGDWGSFGFDGTRSYAGASTAWGGSWAMDSKAGVAYIGTSTATPDWNATDRPGPNLWSDSVLAVNVTSGRLIWGFQALPHPLGDFDCSWNVVLANETVAGHVTPVVFKGCKFGYIFALDAKTGGMLWYLKPPSIHWVNVGVANPLDANAMTGVNWIGYPSKGSVLQNPSDTGALESDLAFDPSSNTIFAAVYNSPKSFPMTDVGAPRTTAFDMNQWEFDWGVNIFAIKPAGPTNTTILGIDASTGNVRWSYFIPNLPYRGGLTVSGGVLYVSTLDGVLRYLNSATGRLIGEKTIGGSLIAQPSIGADASGATLLFLTDMGSSRWGPVFPGFVQSLEASSPPTPAGSTISTSNLYFVTIVPLVAAGAVVGALWSVRRRAGQGGQSVA